MWCRGVMWLGVRRCDVVLCDADAMWCDAVRCDVE